MSNATFIKISVLSLSIIIGACVQNEEPRKWTSDAPAATAVGETENCVTISRIKRSDIHDERTIDFKLSGGKIYRNIMPQACPSLNKHDAISYDIRGNRLCSPEFIYVLENDAGVLRRGAACTLGQFVPIKYIDRELDVIGQ
ncbi:hypothetical protein ACRAQ7_03080 [Erythrobacter sp. W53]|uniref:hypothetical protein n=1 Tax=Erythrobacter sp. W53 TaxID=3425947 RepID=UPI003D76A243